MASKDTIHLQVQQYYGETLSSTADLRTSACCTASAVPQHLKTVLADIHPEVSSRYYGCGLVMPDLLAGLRVLDLGCGSGRDVYVLSRLVGERGEVVGVDMTTEQLAVAERHRDYHRACYGYARSNVRFLEGNIERLDALGLEPGSFDLIVSNCVINLSPDKPAVLRQAHALLRAGGELYFSDVYSDRRVPAALAADPVLYGECLSGALYWNDFLHLAKAAGFADPRLVEDRVLAIAEPDIAARVAPIRFHSATYRLFKLPDLEPGCEDYGQAVAYRGTLPGHPAEWALDKERRFPVGRVVPVCGNTYRMLAESRFAPHFELYAGGGRHLGVFEGCGARTPFADAPGPTPSVTGCR
jgi:SAM-dependent methyltransferase